MIIDFLLYLYLLAIELKKFLSKLLFLKVSLNSILLKRKYRWYNHSWMILIIFELQKLIFGLF